jgi:hypothetical protein
VLGADTCVKGHGGLLLGVVGFPGGDAFVDGLGEDVVLAEAVVVAVVLAFGNRDPSLETLGKD